MNLRRRVARRSTDPLERALAQVAAILANASPDARTLDPHTLQHRKVVSPMDEFDQPDLLPEPQYVDRNGRSTRGATALRLGAGALAGVVATAGFFVLRGDDARTTTIKTAQQGAGTPYLLRPPSTPEGLCLQFAMTAADAEQDLTESISADLTRLKRGKDDHISISIMPGISGGGPEALVGQTVDINGRKGVLNRRGDALGLQWKQGRTGVQMSGTGVNKDELLAVARSVVLSFDENGAHLAGVTAPGFDAEKVDQKSLAGYGNLNYGECDRKAYSGSSKSLSVGTASPTTQRDFFGDPSALMKTTKLKVRRNGKEVDAKRTDQTHGGETFSTLLWQERDAAVWVGFSKIETAQVLAFAESLVEASQTDFDTLRAQAKRPSFPMPVAPGQPDTDWRKIGEIKVGKTTITIDAATQGDKLCVTYSSGSFGGGGGDCQTAPDQPSFQQSFGGPGLLVASALTDTAVTNAKATLPDGSVVDIRSFQDDRLPNLRVFVFTRRADDPVPTRIVFTDASGKVIAEQSSEAGSGPESVVPVG